MISHFDTLLIVEDDPDHAHLIIDVLKEDGGLQNQINWVSNGLKAVNYVMHEGEYTPENAPRPGLILLDIKMPELDGFDVLRRLKSDDRYRSIPIVMLTTTQNTEDVSLALKLGANDYIVKPVVWEDFVRKIRDVGKYWAFVSNSGLAS